jgi:hypothetical protein
MTRGWQDNPNRRAVMRTPPCIGTMKSQAQLILEALQAGEAITPFDALNRSSCFRLGARIYDLRKQGV